MDRIIEIKDLVMNPLWNHLTMNIEKNKISILLGANNSGKTSLLRILSLNQYDEKNCIFILEKDISSYSNKEYDEITQAVFPSISLFREKTVLDELMIQQDKVDTKKIEYLIEELEINKTKEIAKLELKERIKIQIARAIIKAKKVVLIDDLDLYFNKKEIEKLYCFFHKCIKKYDLTFITTCINLDNALYGDELFLIKDGSIALQGSPIGVLSRDNIVNKAGLRIPFMIDLSVKLKDYDLIQNIELEKDKLIDNLWK